MTSAEQIFEYAGSLFDVVAANRSPNSDNIMILGLESTPDRNLDYFRKSGESFEFTTFNKQVISRLESLLKFLHSKGFLAELVRSSGYPSSEAVNLKDEAIRAGIGRRGKNTIVLHPQYGTRLRFTAAKTNAPLDLAVVTSLAEEENPICKGCSICIDICPVQTLEPYHMINSSICL